MRIHVLFGSIFLATAMCASAARAGSDSCCSGTTYSEGGYAFADAYPYDYPYVVSHGFGLRYRYHAFRSAPRAFDGDPFARPVGAPPYTAYRYRTAPSAKIIHVPQDD
jgi:hypothetical protein